MAQRERRSRRIAITGSSGFVGHWLMRSLAAEPAGHVILPFFDVEHGDPGGDVSDCDLVDRRMEALRPEVVIHLASIAAPLEATRKPRRSFEVNVGGTFNIAEAMLKHVPNARLLFVGSSEAYGLAFNDFDRPLTEDAPLRPGSMYGTTKAAADLLVAQMARNGLDAVRFRPFNHTGPGQTTDYVVPAFARQIARIERGLQQPFIHVGNLDAERDILDVRDVVEAYVIAAQAEQELPAGAVFNLATGAPVRIGELLRILLDATDRKIDVVVDPTRLRPSEVPKASGDAARARDILGWQTKTRLEDTLKAVLEYWRERTNEQLSLG
uniref:NAD-dependent epimerase/dehydratase n=1 Tax=Rhodopseudomonas palustris (strain BisA53) TaxID=316055 RepID=Q07IP9_RHOP5